MNIHIWKVTRLYKVFACLQGRSGAIGDGEPWPGHAPEIRRTMPTNSCRRRFPQFIVRRSLWKSKARNWLHWCLILPYLQNFRECSWMTNIKQFLNFFSYRIFFNTVIIIDKVINDASMFPTKIAESMYLFYNTVKTLARY